MGLLFLFIPWVMLNYLIAIPLTDNVSLDLRLTEWYLITTYFWLFGGSVAVVVFVGLIIAFIIEGIKHVMGY